MFHVEINESSFLRHGFQSGDDSSNRLCHRVDSIPRSVAMRLRGSSAKRVEAFQEHY